METKTVETYRVLRDGMKVGDTVRRAGDLIPEAGSWPNPDIWIKNGYIERVWLTEEELNSAKESLGVTPEEPQAGKKSSKSTKSRKKTAKKKSIKVKKTEEKRETDGGPELSEQSV